MPAPDAARPPEGGPDTTPVQEVKDQGTSTDVDTPDPFAVAAPVYKTAGWPPIPVLDGGKGTTPGGVTGYDGVDLDGAKLQQWIKKYGHCVIAVRMPEGVDPDGRGWKLLGLDVDAYDDKPGGETLAKWAEEWGELPSTYVSTSREDGVSGIRFYKVPREWFGIGGGPGLELIQRHHRQAVVAPSLHEKRKVPYRWRAEDGLPAVEIPEAGAMPWLPQSWLDGLERAGGATRTVEVDLGEAQSWLTEGEPCQAMVKILDEYTGHRESVRKLQVKILRHGEQGHRGGRAAWDRLRDRYVDDVTTGSRDGAEEWANLASGAPAQVKNRTPDADKGCCGEVPPVLVLDVAKLLAERRGKIKAEEQDEEPPKTKPAPTAVPPGVPPGLVPHPWEPNSYVSPKQAEELRKEGDPNRRRLRVQRASEIKARATRWLWAEVRDAVTACWLPLGGLVLLAGREGVGKSTIAYEVAAKITRGTLPGAFFGTPRSVIISATEDAWEQTVVPRLMAADADLDRVMRVDAETPKGLPEAIKLPDDLDAMDELVREEDVALVLLDPLMGTISGALDSHKDHDIRLALEPVARLASTSQVTVLGLIHENKSGAADLLNRVMASRAFSAVARAVLYAARDDELDPGQDRVKLLVPERFLFGQLKNNLSRRVPFTLRYHIDGVGVGHDEDLDETIWSSRITWDGIISEGLQEIVRRQEHDAKTADKDTAQGRAARWLAEYLAGKPEGVPAARLRLDGERAGHNLRTLQRAAAVAGVHIEGGRSSVWSIPVAVDVDVVDGAVVVDVAELNPFDDNRDNDDSATGTRSLARNDGADETS